jgi:hypothetical protein
MKNYRGSEKREFWGFQGDENSNRGSPSCDLTLKMEASSSCVWLVYLPRHHIASQRTRSKKCIIKHLSKVIMTVTFKNTEQGSFSLSFPGLINLKPFISLNIKIQPLLSGN